MIEALIGLLAGSSSVAAVWIWVSLSPKMAVRKLIRKRYGITLKGGEGEFIGLLVEISRGTMVLENCSTVPQRTSEAPQLIPGRVRVDRANIAYMQELTNDTV